MHNQLSTTEISILKTICANGGEWRSLFKLATELEIHYETCWTCVMRLAFRGMLQAERSSAAGRGRGYILSLPCGVSGQCLCKLSAEKLLHGVAVSPKNRTLNTEHHYAGALQ